MKTKTKPQEGLCQLCGDQDDVSDFIVVKAEFSRTADRPPGIYRVLSRPFMTSSVLGGGWLHSYEIAFIDKLPKLDETYDISGHICGECAKPYAKKMRAVYGPRKTAWTRHAALRGFDDKAWALEKAHTRATILAHPDMLRDLECDAIDRDADGHHLRGAAASDWKDLQKLYDLPDGLPTWHEWLFVEHRGVKVYYAGYKGADSWMTLHPEPRFRSNGHGPECFSCSGLPTFAKHQDAYKTKAGKSLKHTFGNIGCDELKRWRERQIRDGIEQPDDLDYWKGRVNHYDTEKAIAKAVTIDAIELGLLTKESVAAGKYG